jgi:hypothetical protein
MSLLVKIAVEQGFAFLLGCYLWGLCSLKQLVGRYY